MAGPWSAVANVSPADDDASLPAVDSDQDGDAVIAWQSIDDMGLQRIESRARSAAGALGPIVALSTVTAAGVQVALSPAGIATAVWQRDPGTIGLIEGRVRSAAGAWGAVKILSDTPFDAFEAHVASGTGGSVAVWRSTDGAHFRIESSSGP